MSLKSEQQVLNASYVEASSSLRTTATLTFNGDASNNRVSCIQEDASNAMVSCKSDDAALMRVSALGVTTSFDADAANNRVSAIQDDASVYNVSAKSNDAGTFHVSAIGTLTVSAHEVKQSDAASLRVSAVCDDAAIYNVSAKSNDGALLRTSAVQDDGANLNVSAKSNDGALLRTSSLMIKAGDPTYTVSTVQQTISAAGATAVWTPGAGNSIRVTDVIISMNSAAGDTVYISDAAGIKWGPMYLAANGGLAQSFQTPLQLSANEVLDVSAATDGSIGVSFNGYEV